VTYQYWLVNHQAAIDHIYKLKAEIEQLEAEKLSLIRDYENRLAWAGEGYD